MNKIILFAIFATFCQLSQQKAIKGKNDYKGCGDEYQCFGLAAKKAAKNDDCVKSESCLVLLKTQAQASGEVELDLYWERSSNSSDNWVAAALSEDNMMGNDSATVFILDDKQKVQSMEGLTFVHKDSKKETAGVIPETVKGISIKRTKYANGVLSAKWTREQSTTVGDFTFDLKADKYFILLAYGPVVNGTVLQHHTGAWASPNSVNLEEEADVTTTTVKPTTAPTLSSSKPTETPTKPTGTPTESTGTPTESTETPTESTGTPTESTETPSNSTGTTPEFTGSTTNHTGTTGKGTTAGPHHSSTPKPHGNASAMTMSLFLSIFAAILLFIN